MEDKDYKKLYEEAIERAKYALTTDMDGHWAVNYIFPQLKENKDEKVMKALIHLVKSNKEGSFGIDNYDGIKWDDILSWIEIQGEHKHFRDCIQTGDEVTRNQDGDIVNLSQLRRTGKPIPKFKTGDWVQIDEGHVMKILEVKKDVLCYRILNWCGNESVRKISDIDSIAHLWTIQDAKDGDVLVSQHNQPFIYNGKFDAYFVGAYYGLQQETSCFTSIASNTCRWTEHNNIHPATKEQCALLFQKMREAGYEWVAEKKELKKIEQKPVGESEPKFSVGDWVMLDRPVLITKVEDMPYNTHQYWTSDGKWFGDATKAELWTIQDAKDGDVLKEDSCTFIIERMKPDGTAIVHCCLFDDGDFDLVGSTLSFDVDSTYPATKEQRDLLFQKMKEEGYEWDAEKKELKNIEQKPVDKIEPKFKVGEWIINNDKRIAVPTQVLEVEKYGYVTSRGYVSFDKVKTDYHLWTIEDAEDGDVLAEHETIVLFKKIEGQNIRCYCTYHYLGFNPTFYVGTLQNKNSYCPATNEQSDLLFQKMKETGYEWDFEKKELRTIEKKPYPETLDKAIELYYYSYGNGKGGFDELSLDKFREIVKTFIDDYGNKPAEWSEEDLTCLGYLAKFVDENGDSFYGKNKQNVVKWIRSFANLHPTQKQEWSEEDERNSAFIVAAIDAYSRIRKENDNKNGQDDFDKAVNWIHNRLKYLHPQSSQNWKPSEEQLKTLWDAIIYVEGCHSNFRGGRVLELLYNELKQL